MQITLFIILGVVLIMLLWENLAPRRTYALQLKLKSYMTDVLISVFNNVLMYLLSVTSLYYVAQNLSSMKILGSFDFQSIVIIIATLLFLDFSIYVWHYMNHKLDFLWIFHKVHHSEKYLNTISGIRFHIGELIASVIFKSIFLIFFLGIPINLILISETIILISSLFHHSNIKFKFEKIFGNVLIMPYLHEVHHSSIRNEHDSNYGVLFSFWDRIFGTLKQVKVKEIGLKGIHFQGILQTITFGFKKR